MPAESVRPLSFEQAQAVYEAASLPRQPATLHPGYVAADAARDSRLQPIYLAFQKDGHSWMHCLHLTDVADTPWKDASSPYGYGGPICTTDEPEFIAAAWAAYDAWMAEHKVVVEYVRFHPVLGNERYYGGHVVDNRQVVSVDLTATDFVSGYASRLRQTLKKAQAGGLTYEESALKTRAAEFARYHRAAMREMQTDAFFLFADDYFQRLADSGFAKLGVCSGSAGGDWLAAAVFLDGPGVREYHLAAATGEGRAVGASSLLLHEAALAARAQGMSMLYLGGGSDTRPENPLLFFKSAFSRQRLPYRTGWHVFNTQAYDELKDCYPSEYAAHPERPIFYRKV